MGLSPLFNPIVNSYICFFDVERTVCFAVDGLHKGEKKVDTVVGVDWKKKKKPNKVIYMCV